MTSLILTHLGDSTPFYLRDSIHQFRLWNKDTPVYVIADRIHDASPFWMSLVHDYAIHLVFTDSLTPTTHHKTFQAKYKGDTQFRKGYWKHVKERFFFVEELMIEKRLKEVISMEYDVLVYGSFAELHTKLLALPQTLRMVMDNDERGHPAFLYLPSVSDISTFNHFLVSISDLPLEDMQSLRFYARLFPVHYFPTITEARRRTIPHRRSLTGHIAPSDSGFLSEDSEHFGILFDSLCAGQWLGGIDPRNTGDRKITRYENESALYRFTEMSFEWQKTPHGLWQPRLDGRPLFTIHVHSKALSCFLSDRSTMPIDDYDVHSVFKTLLPNEA